MWEQCAFIHCWLGDAALDAQAANAHETHTAVALIIVCHGELFDLRLLGFGGPMVPHVGFAWCEVTMLCAWPQRAYLALVQA